jgi:hypothetical protein
MPHRSFGPNATQQGKDLLTPSLLRIPCTTCHCILFRVLLSSVINGSEYVLWWNINVSISLNLDIDNLVAYWLALISRKLPSLQKLPSGAGRTPRVHASHTLSLGIT